MSMFNYPHAVDITKSPTHQQNAKHKRILIVEDNQLNSKLLKQLLTAYGYEVWESSRVPRRSTLPVTNNLI